MTKHNNRSTESTINNYVYDKYDSKTKYHLANIGIKLYISGTVTNYLSNDLDLQRIMLAVSYTPEKITRFVKVYQEAIEARSYQDKKHAEKVGAYETFTNSFSIAKDELYYICKIAKVALRNNPQKLDLLQINAKRDRSIAAFFSFMENLYTQALNDTDIIEIMTVYGYHRQRISDCYNNYLQALADYKNYVIKNTESAESTRLRDLKMAVLNEWMLEYYSLHKIAFAHKKTRKDEAHDL